MDKAGLLAKGSPQRMRKQSHTHSKDLLEHLAIRRATNSNLQFSRHPYCKLSEQRKVRCVHKPQKPEEKSKKPSSTDRTLSPHSFMLIGREDNSLPDVRKRRKSALTLVVYHMKRLHECSYQLRSDILPDQKLFLAQQRKMCDEVIRKRFVSKTPDIRSRNESESPVRRSASALKGRSEFLRRKPVQRQITVLPTIRPSKTQLHSSTEDLETLGPW